MGRFALAILTLAAVAPFAGLEDAAGASQPLNTGPVRDLLGAFVAGAAVAYVVTKRYGDVGRLVMILIVPLLSFFSVWAVAGWFGPDGNCSDDCEGNAVFGIIVLVGWLGGIAVATTATWISERRRARAPKLKPPPRE